MSNIAIFIDYDNVSICLEKYYQKFGELDLKTDIFVKIKELFNKDNILTIKAFADFEKIKSSLSELQKSQVELRHVYSSSTRKNASDIALTISVMKSVYSNENIDKYVIVSSDSDMLPIINELRYFNKDVYIIYSEFGSKDGYEKYLSEKSFKSIESIYGFDKYVPIIKNDLIDDTRIQDILTDCLNVINDGITNTFKRFSYNGGGTSSEKDLKDYLYRDQNLKLVENDASLIIDYLKEKMFIKESVSHVDTRYNKALLNINTLNKMQIRTNTKPIENKDYEIIQKNNKKN